MPAEAGQSPAKGELEPVAIKQAHSSLVKTPESEGSNTMDASISSYVTCPGPFSAPSKAAHLIGRQGVPHTLRLQPGAKPGRTRQSTSPAAPEPSSWNMANQRMGSTDTTLTCAPAGSLVLNRGLAVLALDHNNYQTCPSPKPIP